MPAEQQPNILVIWGDDIGVPHAERRPDRDCFDDDGNLVAMRFGSWKAVFMEQRSRVRWSSGIRSSADITSNTYWDWYMYKGYMIMAAQALVQNFMLRFKEFPPRQKAASFTIDQPLDKMVDAVRGS